MPAYAADSAWTSTVPESVRGRSRPDTAAYEGDGVHTHFPHRYRDEGSPGAFWEWFADTPMLDAASVRGWVATIARNVLADHHRRRGSPEASVDDQTAAHTSRGTRGRRRPP